MDKNTIEYLTNNLNSGYLRKEPWTEEEISSLKKVLQDIFNDEEVYRRMNLELGISREEYYDIMKNKEHEYWPKMEKIIKEINLNK